MGLKNNRLLHLSLVGALALASAPSIPTIALAEGDGVDRCAGTVDLPGARLEAGGEEIFFGWIDVGAGGAIAWTCTSSTGVVREHTDCGNDGTPMRWVRAELRNGALYVACN